MARYTLEKNAIDAAVATLRLRLDAHASEKSREFWHSYLRHNASFKGVPMGTVRKVVHHWWKTEELDLAPISDQKKVALRLFDGDDTEDKLAGVLALSEILLPHLSKADLPSFEPLFTRSRIADWNICDWFCVKVLSKMLECAVDRTALARAISAWQNSEPLWQRRASCVAFVNHAKHGDRLVPELPDIIVESCEALVRDPERFAQTGVGWVLKELSIFDKDIVVSFAERNMGLLSREGIKYIVEKMPAHEKKALLARHTEMTKSRNLVRPTVGR